MSAKFIQSVYPQCYTDLIVSARFCQVVLAMHVLAIDSFILRLFHSEDDFMPFSRTGMLRRKWKVRTPPQVL